MADPQIAPSSRNPADNDSMAGLTRIIVDNVRKTLENCLPAGVVAFARNTAKATIRPLIQMVTTSGERVSRAEVASVPVLQFGAGGYLLSFPVKPGDTGFIEACDRDTSLFFQGMSETQPNTRRMHAFADGFFLPAVLGGFTIADEDTNHPVFQSLDGHTRIALWPAFAKVTAERGLVISDQPGEGSPNAVLDVRSTVKASIPWPRMTREERDAIPDPESGMAVWLIPEESLSTFAHGVWS